MQFTWTEVQIIITKGKRKVIALDQSGLKGSRCGPLDARGRTLKILFSCQCKILH